MTKVAVVTGSSSGIGYETSLLLARNQFATYATMRNLNKGDEVRDIASKEKIPLPSIYYAHDREVVEREDAPAGDEGYR